MRSKERSAYLFKLASRNLTFKKKKLDNFLLSPSTSFHFSCLTSRPFFSLSHVIDSKLTVDGIFDAPQRV